MEKQDWGQGYRKIGEEAKSGGDGKETQGQGICRVYFKTKIMFLGAHGWAEPSCLLSSLQIFGDPSWTSWYILDSWRSLQTPRTPSLLEMFFFLRRSKSPHFLLCFLFKDSCDMDSISGVSARPVTSSSQDKKPHVLEVSELPYGKQIRAH